MQEPLLDIVSQMYRGEVTAPGYKFIVSYAEKLNGETVEFNHTHLHYEIYFVLKNRIVSRVEGQDYTLNEGDFLFLAPGAKHNTVYEPGVKKEYFVMLFDVILNHDLERLPLEYRIEVEEIRARLDIINTQKKHIASGNIDTINSIIDSIGREKAGRFIGWNNIVNGYIYHFFLHALRWIKVEKAHSVFEQPPEKLNLGVEASKFIHGNYHRDISLEDAAEYLNISPRHVNRVFRQVFGTTFSRTLSQLRLNYAKNHLSSTDYSIEKISELVGFHTPRTLFKLFNRYENMTVAEYRKKFRNQQPPDVVPPSPLPNGEK